MFCIIIMGDLRLIGDFACAVSVSVGNCMQAGVHITVNNIVMYVRCHKCIYTYVARCLCSNYMFACRII